jgi:hypothetical protein
MPKVRAAAAKARQAAIMAKRGEDAGRSRVVSGKARAAIVAGDDVSDEPTALRILSLRGQIAELGSAIRQLLVAI